MNEVTRATVYILCSNCGEKHRLTPGVATPVYWCGNTLMCLKEGDDVEYDESVEEMSSVFF